MDNLITAFPAPNTGAAQVAVGIVLTGAGITAGVGVGEYELTMVNGVNDSVVVTAQAIDIGGNVLSAQPVITATSTNGAAPAGEGSVQTGWPPANCIGQQIGPGYVQPGFQTDPGTPMENSAVASVSAVVAALATVTLQNVGQCIVEFRTPQGFSARLNVFGTN
jgi:hypothetical protein